VETLSCVPCKQSLSTWLVTHWSMHTEPTCWVKTEGEWTILDMHSHSGVIWRIPAQTSHLPESRHLTWANRFRIINNARRVHYRCKPGDAPPDTGSVNRDQARWANHRRYSGYSEWLSKCSKPSTIIQWEGVPESVWQRSLTHWLSRKSEGNVRLQHICTYRGGRYQGIWKTKLYFERFSYQKLTKITRCKPG